MTTATDPNLPEPFLVDIPETLRLLGNMARRSYQRMISSGKFGPKPIKVGGRVYHRPDELKAWCIAGRPPAARWKWTAS
ncbi:MAG: helix-turn-helix domain-containing protein [Planctomycetaceae bacterium]|nr:helix-turn-helix domain-containing protein [Planctomycetaceae bacterium]